MRFEVVTGIALANKEAIENDKKDAKDKGIDDLEVRRRGTNSSVIILCIYFGLI